MREDARPTLVKASDVTSLPVVTIDGGDDVAEIKDVVYDGARHRLVGFTLNKRGWFRGSMKSVLTADHVDSIGKDAVMILSDDCITDRSGADGHADAADPDEHHRRHGPGTRGDERATSVIPSDLTDVIGATVMSSSGARLGEIVDVVIETGADPSAVGYEMQTDDGTVFVPTSAQTALSGDNVIVPAEADDFIRRDLAGFGASVESFRSDVDRAGGLR